MRLTPSLIQETAQYRSTLNQTTLCIRDASIPMLENLAMCASSVETLDFSNNSITHLTNIPAMPKLQTLVLARNQIKVIADKLPELPRLNGLNLAGNQLQLLKQLYPLRQWSALQNVVLKDNDVLFAENYREFMAWLLPQLVYLDGQKVTGAERNRGVELFGRNWEEATPLALSIIHDQTEVTKSHKLSPEERAQLKKQLAEATTLAEIDRIEQLLK